jgi:phage-related protein
VIIGGSAGQSAGSSNVMIGFNAGINETGNNKLYISNTDANSSNSLIYGEFDNKILSFNAKIGIGTTTPGYKLQVGIAGDGTEARANAWNLLSDIRYKTDIEKIDNALERISGINGFYFHWNTGTDKTRQFGLSAQDVEKVLPEVVSEGDDGYLSVDYGKLVPLLIEGMKEQQQQIESYKSQLQSLQQEVKQIESFIATSGGK